MKQTKLLVLILAIYIPMLMSAAPVEINGIYYNLVSKVKTAEVTSNPNYYSGDIIIPSIVSYEGKDYNVTSIGEYAFLTCSGLTSVTIPNSVTSIEQYAFNNCTGMTSLTIPDGVTYIGDYAFTYCRSLTSITIPNSVTRISDGTFNYCDALISITIPNNVITIGFNAFEDCSSLTSVTIPNSVTSIEQFAFHNCSGLTSVTIPNSVTRIGDAAFKNCSSLTSVTIPNSVTRIGADAFFGCSDLTSITIGSGVNNIIERAFADCPELTDVYCYAEDVPQTSSDAFEGSYINLATLHVPTGSVDAYKAVEPWKYFKEIVSMYTLTYMVDGEVYKTYALSEGEVISPEPAPTKAGYTFFGWSEIPGTMPAHNVTVTGTFTGLAIEIDGIYYNLDSDLKTAEVISNPNGKYEGDLTIPKNVTLGGTNYSVTSIGKKAFNECSGLTSVTIPNSVTEISTGAFYGCTGLTTVTIPNSVTSIEEGVFWNCSGLTSVTIPNSVTSIGYCAFYNCSSLTSVTIPNSVTTIGSSAFWNCTNLTSVTIPNSVTTIGSYAFGGCSGLTSVTIPNSVTDIGGPLFYGCSRMESINVEEGNTAYDSRDNCNAIIEKSSKALISGCKNSIIPNSVTSIGVEAFYGCSGLTSVTIPNSVTWIDMSAFLECTDLTSVTIPNSVTSIGFQAFADCTGLTSVIIPNSVTSIGNSAFSGCTNLSSVISLIETPFTIDNDVFGVSSSATLYVPVGTKEKYEAFGGWTKFQEIVELKHPEAKSDLAYTGTAQDLISASPISTMQYSLDGTTYNTTIPQGTDAKEYTIYYKEENLGIANSFKVTIAAKTLSNPTITLSETSYVYDSNAKEPTVTVKDGETTIPSGEYMVSYSNNTNVGTATVTITDKDGGNYTVSGSTTFTISAADGSLTPPTAKSGLVYSGAAQDLITAGSSTTGTMQYSLDGTDYSTEIPQGTDAKEYTVYYKLVANAGYNDVDPASFKVTIAAKTVSSPTITLSETSYTYDDNAKEPTVIVKDGETTIPSGEYSVSYSNNTNVGTATVTITDKDGGNYTVSGSATFEIKAKEDPVDPTQDETETIKISSAKQVTYMSDKNLDFTTKPELKAYVATGYDKASGTIWLTRVKYVPAKTGFLLMGESSEYEIPVKTGDATSYYMNYFKGTIEGKTIYTNEGDNTNYYLSDGESGVGFYKVQGSVTLKANRAYLSVPTEISAVGTTGNTEMIQVSSAGQVPYYNSESLDFSSLAAQGVKAYTATGYDYSSGTIWLTRVMKVPAKTGMLIMAPKGDYPVPTASVASVYRNMFKGTLSGTRIFTHEEIEGRDYINYYLSNGTSGVGFYKVTAEEGVELKANRSYLPILNKEAAGTRSAGSGQNQIAIEEADEVIGIQLFRGTTNLTPALSQGEGEGEWYTLQGQRVAKPGKGLYIRNGKVVVIK